MITGDQIAAHLVGDYILQSDWMASEKTKKSTAALAHVVTYTLPFVALTRRWEPLLFILMTHFIIDRWRLARYVVWAKNWLAPRWITPTGGVDDPVTFVCPPGRVAYNKVLRNRAWAQCSGTGYDTTKPAWLAVWLLIIADNTLHLLLNGLALRFWP